MKSKLIVLVLTILYLNFYYIELSVAQTRSDVCTPKGNSVIAYITTENLDNMRAYYDNYYANAYPNAEQIITYDGYSSTRRFNCHGYAWHISDGGSARWIGMGSPYDNNPEYQYWQDGSYSEVSGYVPYPGKVNWASGDHSAITTTESGVLISKWNEYPLMKHAWNDSPYGTSNLKYYKLNFQISGPSVLCNSPEAYNLTNTPGGAITWTNSNNTSRVSNQGSNPCNFSSVSNGSGWIKASFTSGCGTSFTLDQKNIWVGGPETPVIDGSTYITCDNELFTEDNRKTVTWSVYGPMQIVGQTYGYRCTIEGTGNGYGWVYATAANGCDTITSELFVEVDCGYLLVFTPNPATGETILSIESTSEKKIVDETIDWELEVYDQAQNLKLKNPKAQGKEYRFNTSGWKEGIYVARVKYDDKILTGKLVVKK